MIDAPTLMKCTVLKFEELKDGDLFVPWTSAISFPILAGNKYQPFRKGQPGFSAHPAQLVFFVEDESLDPQVNS
jgi:hypothetical protein